MKKNVYEKLPDVVGVIEEFYGRFHLEQDRERVLLRHVRSVKGQLYQPRADDSVVREHLSAIRKILQSCEGNELADAAVAEIEGMIGPGESHGPGEKKTSKEKTMSEATEQSRRRSPATMVLAAVGAAAGLALAVAGCWLIHDGLLEGLVADHMQVGIGGVALVAGVILLMLGVPRLLPGRVARVVLSVVLLGGVTVFAIIAASSAARSQEETVNLGRDAEMVTIDATGQDVLVPPQALRRPRWYERGIDVTVKNDGDEMTIPRKFVVMLDE